MFYVKLARDAYNPHLKREGYSVKFFDKKGAQAYLLSNPTHQIVVFRGTDEIRDWLAIAKSHEGFMKYAETLLDIPLDYEKPLVLVGHSLGGVMSVCFASLVKHNNVEIYSFGCPRVGGKEFVDKVKHIPHTRYVTTYDHVPHLPLFLYHHGKEVKLPKSRIKSLFNNHRIDFYVKMMKKLTYMEK